MEWDLPYEDIKLYRSFTRNELKKEKKNISSLYDTESKSANDAQSTGGGGWLSSWWGGSKQLNESKEN